MPGTRMSTVKKLYPAVYLFWKRCKEQKTERLKDIGEAIVISGDEKRCWKQSSRGILYIGFEDCIQQLIPSGLVTGIVITDRHMLIEKHMRKQLSHWRFTSTFHG